MSVTGCLSDPLSSGVTSIISRRSLNVKRACHDAHLFCCSSIEWPAFHVEGRAVTRLAEDDPLLANRRLPSQDSQDSRGNPYFIDRASDADEETGGPEKPSAKTHAPLKQVVLNP